MIAIAGLREQLPGRPDHQLGQTEALDARRRAKHHPQQEQDRDHHAHAQPEGDDADGGEGARPEEGARGMKQVRNESVHRCPNGVWVDTLDLSRAQIRRPRVQREVDGGGAAGVPSCSRFNSARTPSLNGSPARVDRSDQYHGIGNTFV